MSFSQVIGHDKSKEYFVEMINQNKLSHAFLFEGMAGIGKSLLTFQIAKGIFCQASNSEPCNQCKSCLKMNHENHPDYMEIKPDGKQIKNYQIEEFQRFLNNKAYDGGYKIVCIHQADKMNLSAQNRILKTLEEPSEKVIMFLISDKPSALTETVRSRCQSIKLSGLSEALIVNHLEKNYNLTEDKSLTYAKLSSGSLGKAIHYATSETFFTIQTEVMNLLKAIDQKEKTSVIKSLNFFATEKENITDIFEYMVLWYRDLLLYKKAKAKSLLLHSNDIDFIKKISRHLSVKQIIKNIETINWTERKLNQNGQFDLTIELMLIQLLEV